ncbi:pyrimidine 5'-nucleotidase [Longilinea arvoryzae]|uniref:Pyrimidine 5'-nucleotidase n=1 Tax=Longilinea arvoryzae TaxID=360412 RepID=A0A0S7BH21_9CHLR|nr:pyrimidine 5'-nucleotidase [Longilinea arvoryzae]GAP14372.1 pyrimidine 5'-nucleotidase [Longilinea arvoryzae]
MTLFIDLDDTLYPADCGLWKNIRDRIDLYMHSVLGIPLAEVPPLRHRLFKTYGTTLRGLEATLSVDPADYLRFVHDVPLEHYLKLDAELRQVLVGYTMPKFIFTNGDCAHASRVLKTLGLEGLFDGIIDIVALSPYCKPMPEAFEIALARAGCPQPADCVLVDDFANNLAVAHQLGFRTVLIGSPNPAVPFAPAIPRLADLPTVIPQSNGDLSKRKEKSTCE